VEASDGVEVRLARDQEEIEAAQQLRVRVFSAEQGIAPEAEIDGLDATATHLVALRRDRVVGTCRLRFPRGKVKIERMAVDKALRRTGIGARLVAAAEQAAAGRGSDELVLHAQLRSQRFYAACGYEAVGETFLEEGIPHVLMRRRIDLEPRAGR
jgi:predicted GNAT family N-acyltransferase